MRLRKLKKKTLLSRVRDELHNLSKQPPRDGTAVRNLIAEIGLHRQTLDDCNKNAEERCRALLEAFRIFNVLEIRDAQVHSYKPNLWGKEGFLAYLSLPLWFDVFKSLIDSLYVKETGLLTILGETKQPLVLGPYKAGTNRLIASQTRNVVESDGHVHWLPQSLYYQSPARWNAARLEHVCDNGTRVANFANAVLGGWFATPTSVFNKRVMTGISVYTFEYPSP